MTFPPSLSIFEDLLLASPSGREWSVAAVIRQKLDALGNPHETDPAGNILVRLEGENHDAPLVCLASHMDEIGMVVTKIEPDGSLRVSNSGGLRPWKLGEGPVELVGDEENVIGILSMGSTHTAKNDGGEMDWDAVRVMTGLTPSALAAAGIRPGTVGVPTKERRGPVLFGDPADPLVGAWTFDDRIGCVTLLRLLESLGGEAPHVPMIIAFTTQEEVGGHGAKSLCFREKPETFIAVDGSPTPPETDLALDGRPGIWSKDRLAHYDQRLLAFFQRCAEKAGTELQPAVFTSAASDASLVGYAGLAPRIACIGHVRENSHGYEVARLSVFENLLHTLEVFVREWTGR